jgi:serine/threonine-protein kinase
VQGEISTESGQALKGTLSGTDQQRMSSHGTANVEAYNKYLLGRHLWNKRGPQDLLDAVTPLQEAVALDPGYDQAWAALAETYVLIPEYGAGSMDQYIPLTREATEKALTINPASARALTARGYLKAMYEYDVDAALADFEQAITLDPTYPTARQWYGEILAVAGRIEDALEQISIAKELDPLATVIHHVEGWLLDHEGRDEEALKAYNNVHKIDPYKAHTYSNLSFLYARMGEFEKAREAERTWSELSGIDVTPILAVYDAMEDSSLKPAAIQLLQESDYYIDGASFVTPFYMLLGETELTLDSLERAFERGDPYAIHMQRFEIYDPLHDHPRFQALLRKMNLLP